MKQPIGKHLALAALAVLALAGCRSDDAADQTVVVDQTADAPAAGTATDIGTPQPARPVEHDMRLEVDIAARELHVYRGDQRASTYSVAVGREEWPTRTGEWQVGQVVWNPEWIPPEEEWAEDRERKAPGDPDNPLGRVQLVYDAPRSIHGTNEPGSIGQAVSHGSIRMRDDELAQLARQVMEVGGEQRDEGFFNRVRQNRTQREVVNLSNPVPIRVHQGGRTGG
jgi:lipoprotein-anchoring transpeptidase ErfK/SrfK